MQALAIQVALLMFVPFVLFRVTLEGPVSEVYWLIYLKDMIGIILVLKYKISSYFIYRVKMTFELTFE